MGDSCGGPARGWFQARGAPEWRAQAGQGGGFLEGAPVVAGTAGNRRRSMGTLPMPGPAFQELGFQSTRDFS